MDIKRSETESNIMYMYRKNYIDTRYNEKSDINNLIKNSKIAVNIKFKKCKYDPKIIKLINDDPHMSYE